MEATKTTKKVQLDLPRCPKFKKDLKLMATYQGFDSPKAMMERMVILGLETWKEVNKDIVKDQLA